MNHGGRGVPGVRGAGRVSIVASLAFGNAGLTNGPKQGAKRIDETAEAILQQVGVDV